MKRFSFYGIISIIGYFIRTFLLPNPFVSMGDRAVIINYIAGLIIPVIAYVSVGVFYTKGSSPAFGSFCFTVTYAVIVGILYLVGLFHFRLWAILAFIVIYVLIIAKARIICERIRVRQLTRF